jgi:hypothetical protein
LLLTFELLLPLVDPPVPLVVPDALPDPVMLSDDDGLGLGPVVLF